MDEVYVLFLDRTDTSKNTPGVFCGVFLDKDLAEKARDSLNTQHIMDLSLVYRVEKVKTNSPDEGERLGRMGY